MYQSRVSPCRFEIKALDPSVAAQVAFERCQSGTQRPDSRTNSQLTSSLIIAFSSWHCECWFPRSPLALQKWHMCFSTSESRLYCFIQFHFKIPCFLFLQLLLSNQRLNQNGFLPKWLLIRASKRNNRAEYTKGGFPGTHEEKRTWLYWSQPVSRVWTLLLFHYSALTVALPPC